MYKEYVLQRRYSCAIIANHPPINYFIPNKPYIRKIISLLMFIVFARYGCFYLTDLQVITYIRPAGLIL